MSPIEIYHGSNGAATRQLYEELVALGPAGALAMNLFRACKRSSRAKVYRGRGYKDAAYERKTYSMKELCKILAVHGKPLCIEWGFAEDPDQEFHNQVLYVDLPTGQVSFHTDERYADKDYPGQWDGSRDSAGRIIKYTTDLLYQPAAPCTSVQASSSQ